MVWRLGYVRNRMVVVLLVRNLGSDHRRKEEQEKDQQQLLRTKLTSRQFAGWVKVLDRLDCFYVRVAFVVGIDESLD